MENNRITCIGAGRLGLSWALCVERAGFEVLAVDIFPTYVDAINAKTLRSSEPQLMEMLKKSKHITATLSMEEGAAFSRDIYVFVQTPSSGSNRHYDHTHLNDVLSQLNALRIANKNIVICCTVMPGFCDTVAPALLKDCTNVTVSYSPEFIAQGAIIAGTLAPDMVLIGEGSPEAGNAIEYLTQRYVTNAPQIRRMSPGSAEVAKLALNSFVTLKIAFANFIGDMADAAEAARQRACAGTVALADPGRRIDKMQIAQAIGSDSRIGLKCLLPGYGFGGPCFPRDGRALAAFAGQVSSATRPLDTTIVSVPGIANESHARFQAQQLVAAANAMLRTGARACTIVFDDVTFKPQCAVPIVQESQKLVVAGMVRDMSEHTVAIREKRNDILSAVRKEYGILFAYWSLETGELPKTCDSGMAYVIADDELLPTRDGMKVLVPINNKVDSEAPAVNGAKRARMDEDEADVKEQRGGGRASMSVSFTT